jgi:hypothetical protein
MAKVNLDVAEKLDITCRKGDTFELILTLKDSSGTALPLVTDKYKFILQVRGASTSSRSRRGVPSYSTSDGEDRALIIGSSELGAKAQCNFVFRDIDDNGNVTVFLSDQDMRKVPAGRYRYDFQYVKPRDTGDIHKTLLEGRFTVKEDISKSS